MDRDRRLTGFLRGQTDNPSAPAGFELNNPWRVSRKAISFVDDLLIFRFPAREAHHLVAWLSLLLYICLGARERISEIRIHERLSLVICVSEMMRSLSLLGFSDLLERLFGPISSYKIYGPWST
jgi:hypothetical protein